MDKKKTYTAYLAMKAAEYANSRDLDYEYYNHKVVFNNVHDNFYPMSWEQLQYFPQIFNETTKYRKKYKDGDVIKHEMQKHDSELVLLLNFMLSISPAKLKDMFSRSRFNSLANDPRVNQSFKVESNWKNEVFQIDMIWGTSMIVPLLNYPKTIKSNSIYRYLNIKGFDDIFELDSYIKEFAISNFNVKFVEAIIVASQQNLTPYFILDARRPEVISHCYKTISFIKDSDFRLNCKVLYWQDLVKKSHYQLAEFINEKYGISSEDTFLLKH